MILVLEYQGREILEYRGRQKGRTGPKDEEMFKFFQAYFRNVLREEIKIYY